MSKNDKSLLVEKECDLLLNVVFDLFQSELLLDDQF